MPSVADIPADKPVWRILSMVMMVVVEVWVVRGDFSE
jgi:hypothetical protein